MIKMNNEYKVALAGNPNVGKSTVFNQLTKSRQHTGNWTGKTVESAEGEFFQNGKRYKLIDIPGTYSLLSLSPEEKIAADILKSKQYDAVVVVCDATGIERNLNLVLQVLAIAKKALVCVNLMDQARKKGIEVDIKELERCLGVRTIGITAQKKQQVEFLRQEIVLMLENPLPPPKKRLEREAFEFFKTADEICKKAVKRRQTETAKADKIITGKFTAYPIMFLALLGVFWLTITASNYPSALLQNLFLHLEKVLRNFLFSLHCPEILRSVLIDGVYKVTAWVTAVMLPPMAIFFPLFTLLEDSGFLPRVAYCLDNSFKKCKGNSKQSLCMCMGFGCNAVGVTGCRIIDSEKERLKAILTNSFVPCNGRFPMIILIITLFFCTAKFSSLFAALVLSAVIAVSVFCSILATKLLSITLINGEPSPFVLELPDFRKPLFGKVLVRSLRERTVYILARAVKVAAPAGLVIWLMANVTLNGNSLLFIFSNFLDPLGKILGLDGVILTAFILGFPANEIVVPIILMTYLSRGVLTDGMTNAQIGEVLINNGWSIKTAVCMIIFTLFHWPCSTTLLTIKKETDGIKWTAVSVLLPLLFGVILCFASNLILTAFGL